MRYITCAEAANFMGMTVRRIQQMCKNGKIVGAIKQGRAWMIPKEFFGESKDVILNQSHKRKPLPIGVSDFKLR